MGGGGGEFSRNFFRYQIPCMNFFRPQREYFLGLIGVQEFFSSNFPLREYFFCTQAAPPPISFLMIRPLESVLTGFDCNLYESKFIFLVTYSLPSRRRHCLSFRITNNTLLSLRISIVFMIFNCTQLDQPISHVGLGELLVLQKGFHRVDCILITFVHHITLSLQLYYASIGPVQSAQLTSLIFKLVDELRQIETKI